MPERPPTTATLPPPLRTPTPLALCTCFRIIIFPHQSARRKRQACFVQAPYTSFVRFHSQPRRLLHFTFTSTGQCPVPPWVGSRFTLHNTAPVLVSYGFASTPVWGLGTFAAELSTVVRSCFSVVPHIELSHVVICGRDTSASSSVIKIPATSTSRLRAPCPG